MGKLLLVVNMFFAIFYDSYGADAANIRSQRSCDPGQQQETQSISRDFGPPPSPFGFPPPPFGSPPFGPPPPPYGFPPPHFRPHPPPFLRTQNWSGYHKTADGSQQGVFSGAAAESGPSGQAYSLASSDVGSPYYSSSYGQSFGVKGLNYSESQGRQTQPGSYGQTDQSSSSAPVQSSSNSGTYRPSVHDNYAKSVGSGSREKEQQFTQDSGKAKGGYSSNQSENKCSNNVDSQRRPSEYTRSYGQPGSSSAQAQSFSNSDTYLPLETDNYGKSLGSGSREREQQFSQHSGNLNDENLGYQTKGFNKDSQGRQAEYTDSYGKPTYLSSAQAQGNPFGPAENERNSGKSGVPAAGNYETNSKENLGYDHDISRSQRISSDSNYNHVSYNFDDKAEKLPGPKETGTDESVQSTLKGALDLASQGLQVQGNQGCSTCQKGSLAFSNARTNQGSAVAVSIGG